MNETSHRLTGRRRGDRRKEGSFLLVAAILLTFVLSLVLSTMSVVTSRVRDVRHSRNQIMARHAAESGVHDAIARLHTARDFASLVTAFSGIDTLDANANEGPNGYSQLYSGQPLRDSSGVSIAEYDVFVDIHERTSTSRRRIDLSCYAYVPSKTAFSSGQTDATRSDAHVTVTAEMDGANVFDYAYFINHWGWFFGDTITSNGNVRSNGQFDFGGYASTINGSPRYLGSSGTGLLGYIDDNNEAPRP